VVRVEVAPQIGRIVSFQRVGGREWLAIKDAPPPPGWHWNPWGGDRLWPTAQFLSHQIYGNNGEDPVIDGAPWKIVSQTKTAMEIESGLSPELGLVATRRIELPPGLAEVIQTFRYERRQSSPFPVHVWAITAIAKADVILMESDAKSVHPQNKAFRWWKDQSPAGPPPAALLEGTQVLRADVQDAMKLGTYGTWIAGLRDREAFLQVITYPRGQLFLEASNLQAYWEPKTGICELETISPSWNLPEGESRSWTVRWKLVEFPEGMDSMETKAEALQKAAAGDQANPIGAAE
jgi:hypothetical protein